jgi:hypothetical protein
MKIQPFERTDWLNEIHQFMEANDIISTQLNQLRDWLLQASAEKIVIRGENINQVCPSNHQKLAEVSEGIQKAIDIIRQDITGA